MREAVQRYAVGLNGQRHSPCPRSSMVQHHRLVVAEGLEELRDAKSHAGHGHPSQTGRTQEFGRNVAQRRRERGPRWCSGHENPMRVRHDLGAEEQQQRRGKTVTVIIQVKCNRKRDRWRGKAMATKALEGRPELDCRGESDGYESIRRKTWVSLQSGKHFPKQRTF